MKTKFIHIAVSIVFLLTAFTTHAQNWLLKGNNGIDTNTNFLGTIDNRSLPFRTHNAERMRITYNGRVAIGVKSPSAKLHIDGGNAVQLSTGGYIAIGNTSKANLALDTNIIQARSNKSYSSLYVNPLGGTTYIGSYTSDGAVVKGNLTGLTAYGGNGTGIYASAGGDSRYYGGYFSQLDGTAIYGYSGGQEQAIIGYQSGTGDGILGITYSGGYGIDGFSAHGYGVYGGTGDANSYAGYFAGNLYTTGTFQGSDEKLKQDIKEFSSAIDIIKQLHPKQYQYRQDGSYKLMNLPKGEHYGLIAQDVQKILPDVVKDSKFDVDKATVKEQKPFDPNNPKAALHNEVKKTGEVINFKAVNYTEFIPILIKGVQEQEIKIESQQQSIEELKRINQQQQEQINQLKNLLENKLGITTESTLSSAVLLQNAPNPFKDNTVVQYSLPAKFSSAQIIVTDNTGKFLKQMNVSGAAKGSVNINTSSLAAGTYNYSLWIDERLIDSKQMVIIK